MTARDACTAWAQALRDFGRLLGSGSCTLVAAALGEPPVSLEAAIAALDAAGQTAAGAPAASAVSALEAACGLTNAYAGLRSGAPPRWLCERLASATRPG